jgi:hypothetical protein
MNKSHTINFLKSILLFLIALLLLTTTAPIGFIYTIIRQLIVNKVKTLSLYFTEIALVLDEAGNVIMQHILNDFLLIKKRDTYYFGNKKETISSVIGKNYMTETLSPLGIALNSFLNFIDKGHSLNSIMYDVKAWEQQNDL